MAYPNPDRFRARILPSKKGILWLKELQDVLNANGTELVIAYPPTRGLVAAKYIPKDMKDKFDYNPKLAAKNYRALLKNLRDEGINIVGVPNYGKGENFFRKRDQHWNANGARTTARNVAEYVKKLPVYKELTRQEYKTVKIEEYQFDGRFNDVTKKFCDIELAQETDTTYETNLIGGAEDEASLFGDVLEPEVVLIGTSNSKANSFNVNFDGFLKEYLSADVKNNAVPGAGIDNPFFMYVNSEDYKKNPPKLIIWGFLILIIQLVIVWAA